jgi:hypothetical protein
MREQNTQRKETHMLRKAATYIMPAAAIVALVVGFHVRAGTGNCPTCRAVDLQIVSPNLQYYYDPSAMLCVEPFTSDSECLTSSLYEATINRMAHFYGVWGPWEPWTYNPCYTNDTECWRK